MNHFNNVIDKLMACKTDEEAQAIMTEEANRVENLDEQGFVNEIKETQAAVKHVTDEVRWHVRLKAMKQHYGWSDDDLAMMAEYKNTHSYRTSIRKTFPGLLKLAIRIFEKEQART
jgi:hypothetical protein